MKSKERPQGNDDETLRSSYVKDGVTVLNTFAFWDVPVNVWQPGLFVGA